jgi:uncharacterized OB-fold protein
VEGLGQGFWEGAKRHVLCLQRCLDCKTWQGAPEVVCRHCGSDRLGEEELAETKGILYSWQRVWYPVHPALKDAVPYAVVLVAMPNAPAVRLVGNLVNDPGGPLPIGATLEAVFEDHGDDEVVYTLIQWRLVT